MTLDEFEAVVWHSAPDLRRAIVDTILAAAEEYGRACARGEVSATAHRRAALDAELASADPRRGRPKARAAATGLAS
jgi:hypothetical protein